MLLPAIEARFACRRFVSGETPDAGQLAELIEAGRLAPSAFGLEPWHFVPVVEPVQRAAVARACFDQPAAETAGAFIVVIALVDALDPDSDYVRNRFEAEARGGDTAPVYEAYRAFYRAETMASWACGQCNFAVAHMLLQAAHTGWGSCPIGGFDAVRMSNALALSRAEVPAVAIALGRCAHSAAERLRKPI